MMSPPQHVREIYAQGIIELFLYLMDPYSDFFWLLLLIIIIIIIYVSLKLTSPMLFLIMILL